MEDPKVEREILKYFGEGLLTIFSVFRWLYIFLIEIA